MGLDRAVNLRPVRAIDPRPPAFHRNRCDRWILNELWHAWRARFPFCSLAGRNKFGKAGGNRGRRIGLTIALDRRAEQPRHSLQNLHRAIFGVAAQTNDGGNIEIEFPKCLGQSVSRPILFLARNTGARTEISHQLGLSQNDSTGAIHLGRRRIAARIGEIGDGKSRIHNRVHRHHRSAATGAVKTHQAFGIFRRCRGQLREIKCAAMVEWSGPRITSHAIRRVEAARSSIPVPPPGAKIIVGARVASSIANERKNSRSIAIFSSTKTASTGNCPTFISSMRAAWPRATSGFFAKATPPMPARPVVQAWILTTTSLPFWSKSSLATATASSAVEAARPRGILNPFSARMALP